MLFVVAWVVLAVVVGWAASQKGRSGGGFFLMSLLLSPLIGLLVLIAVPVRAPAAVPTIAVAPAGAAPPIGRYVLVGGGLIVLLYFLVEMEKAVKPAPSAVTFSSSPPVTARTDAPGLVFSNPSPSSAPNRSLAAEEIRETQRLLYAQGFGPGTADGVAGPETVAAVKRYETRRGWSITGAVDLRLLEALRAGAPR